MALSKITTASLADDSVTGAKIENNPTIAGNLTVSGGFNSSTTTSGKNIIINGAMKVHQRVATLTHNDKAVDRFALVKNNLDTADFTTRHYVAGEAEIREFGGDSLEIKCTTADTNIGANELIYVRQSIEAQYLRRLSFGTANAKTTTISFWVYSNVTGTYAFTLVTQDGTARNIGGTYTINSANTWEKKTITFVGDASATINNDNGHGVDVCWILSAGSNWTGTSNTSWANYAGGRLAHGHNVNIASAINKYWYLTGVQWEEGPVATEFEQETYDVTLQKCQRYYEEGYVGFGANFTHATHYQFHQHGFNTPKRSDDSYTMTLTEESNYSITNFNSTYRRDFSGIGIVVYGAAGYGRYLASFKCEDDVV